jgi:antitoxin MazE9
MKVSVSLSKDDIDFLDDYAHARGYESRSAVVQKAVALLRASQLGKAYEDAWASWDAAGEADAWDATAADGLGA